jgi:hypothetical protein
MAVGVWYGGPDHQDKVGGRLCSVHVMMVLMLADATPYNGGQGRELPGWFWQSKRGGTMGLRIVGDCENDRLGDEDSGRKCAVRRRSGWESDVHDVVALGE